MGNTETKTKPEDTEKEATAKHQTNAEPQTSADPQTRAAPQIRAKSQTAAMPQNKAVPQKIHVSQNKTGSATNQNVLNHLPKPFSTERDFICMWIPWKELFVLCIKKIDQQNVRQHAQKYMLLNRMGSVALDICEKTRTSVDEESFESLIQLFDNYHTFQNMKRKPMENPYSYVQNLKARMPLKSPESTISMVKAKLEREIRVNEFINAAYSVLPSFNFDPDFHSLTLNEIAFIWQLCDTFEHKKIYNIVDCNSCGLNHKNMCSANELQCSLCKGFNHLSARCPRIYRFDCDFCGGKHRMRECPAFGEVCRRCNRRNHFSWRCDSHKIISCRFCATSHQRNRTACPARNYLCNRCNTMGHFSFKCNVTGNS